MRAAVVVLANKTLGTTFCTPWIDARGVSVLKLQWSSDNVSSPVGALTVEESNDPLALSEAQLASTTESTASTAKAIDVTADATRVVALGTGAAVAAANNTEFVVYNPAPAFRLKYTVSSGGATAKAQLWLSTSE